MSDPLYLAIYHKLKNQIEHGKYPIGTHLSSEKEFATKFRVSTITIKKSLDLLKEDGYIIRKPRKGSIVVATSKAESTSLTRTSTTIGLVITNFNDVFGAQILRAVSSYNKEPINIVLKISYGQPRLEDKQISQLLDMNIDGIILLPSSSEYTSPLLLKLISKHFPIVVIDRLMPDLPICSVKTNSSNASKDLTEFLFNKGHKNVGIITSNAHVTTINERVNGFLSAHIENNIAINNTRILSTIDSVVPNSKGTVEEDISSILNYLQINPELTGIVTTEYNIALLVASAITRLGKSIPLDYSVVCFDHPEINIFDENNFSFTHILQSQNQIGTTAINLILSKIKDPSYIKKAILPYRLVEGNSVKNIVNSD